jgi:outer membrane immunogenic protein
MKKLLMATTALTLLAGVGAASAADLPSRSAPPVAPVYVPPAFTWTGFYVGVNAGYAWANNNDNNFGVFGFNRGGNNGGFIGGAQVGYNYQFGVGSGFVIGAEADIQWVDFGGHNRGAAFTNAGTTYFFGGRSSGNYLGTVRLRAGYAFDRFLVYATGGLAYGDAGRGNGIAYAVTAPGGTLPFGGVNPGPGSVTTAFGSSGSSTQTGWTLGGGFEYAITPNLTAKAEYLYYNLSHRNNALTPFFAGSRHDNDGNIVRVGLNYKFW